MNLIDAINAEDRIEIKKSEYYALVKNTTQLELMIRLLKNNTSIKVVKTAFNIKDQEG